MKHDIKPKSTGNAVAQEDFQILPSAAVVVARESAVNSAEILKRYGLARDVECEIDHSYSINWTKLDISEFSGSIVTYLAGYLAKNYVSVFPVSILRRL
jgi:hypothetical protein